MGMIRVGGAFGRRVSVNQLIPSVEVASHGPNQTDSS